MSAIETRLLPPEEWESVRPFAKERGNGLPTLPEQSAFLGAYDGAALAGVLAVETVFHFPFLSVLPSYRGGSVALALMREADALIPKGHSAIVLADRPRVTRVMQRLGMEDRGKFRLMRKDF